MYDLSKFSYGKKIFAVGTILCLFSKRFLKAAWLEMIKTMANKKII